MKCPYCNAEVKKGQTVCPYCDSEIEIKEVFGEKERAEMSAKSRSDTVKTISKTFLIAVIVVVISGTLLLFGTLFIVLRFGMDADGEAGGFALKSGTGKVNPALQSLTDQKGLVLSAGGDGKITLQFNGREYEGVEILDKEMLDWLEETGDSLEERSVLFSTNENGDIRKLSIKGFAPFLVLAEDEGRYTACMDQEIVQFTSRTPLQYNMLYDGYFSYPKQELVATEYANFFVGVSMYYDDVSSGKRTVQKEAAYTGEEVTLYQIGYNGDWYYCTQEIYDTLEEGDRLLEYTFYSLPPCVTYP